MSKERSPSFWITYPILRYADFKNRSKRSLPLSLQYFSNLLDNMGARYVKVPSLALCLKVLLQEHPYLKYASVSRSPQVYLLATD